MYKVKKLTNITKEDFTFQYDGVSFTVKAGEALFLHDIIADHGAMHLARKIVRDRVKTGQKTVGEGYSYLEDKDLPTLQAAMVQEVETESGPAPETAQERIKRETRELNNKFGKAPPLTESTKKELLEIAEARGLDVSVKSTKEEIIKAIEEATKPAPAAAAPAADAPPAPPAA